MKQLETNKSFALGLGWKVSHKNLNVEFMTNIDKRLDAIEKKLDGIVSVSHPVFSGQVSPTDDEIDLRELCNVIWGGKWIIIAITFIIAVASIIYVLSLPDLYKSEVLLAPAEENSGGGLAGMAGQFGGLASIAGLNLGRGGNDKTALALEVLKSREFISKFILKHDLAVALMAAKGWDRKSDNLVINRDLYDMELGDWVMVSREEGSKKPSIQETYNRFIGLLSIVDDKSTNFVSLGVEFYSPEIAREWVSLLVEDINLEIKRRDVGEAEKSIEYLSQQLEKTSVADMRAVFYELIEEQTKIVMFANVRDEYVFKTIDAAVAPELKSKPRRSLIVIISVMLGGVLAVAAVLVRKVFQTS